MPVVKLSMIERVTLTNYRNFSDKTITLVPDFNIIIAPNGTGKTNFLESIYYSVFGDSFRPVGETNEMLGDFEKMMSTSITIDSEVIKVIFESNKRKFILNNKKTFQSKLPTKFPLILFAPQSVDLVSREPSLRRNDLDHFLSIINPRYKSMIYSYKSILKNRNAMIKMIRDSKAKKESLSFWTEKLIDSSVEVFDIRTKFFDEINQRMEMTIGFLGKELEDDSFKTLQASYLSFLGDFDRNSFRESLSLKFTQNIEKELIVGKTLYGIHKDDFQITLRGMNLRFLGSRGQQRIGIFLFKLSEAYYIKDKNNIMPILLLDDLMSELDNTNRNKLVKILEKVDTQKIITTADKNEIPEKLLKEANIIYL